MTLRHCVCVNWWRCCPIKKHEFPMLGRSGLLWAPTWVGTVTIFTSVQYLTPCNYFIDRILLYESVSNVCLPKQKPYEKKPNSKQQQTKSITKKWLLVYTRNWSLKEIQEWLAWERCSKGICITLISLVTPGDIIHLFHWEKMGDEKTCQRGNNIQQAGSSLLHRFLLPVCELEGWGRLSPLYQNLCLRSFRDAPGSVTITTETAFVKYCGWD